jgi:hypothetical protein
LTGVRLHPPGRTDKNLCRCFGAPARRVSPDLQMVRAAQASPDSGLLFLERAAAKTQYIYKTDFTHGI